AHPASLAHVGYDGFATSGDHAEPAGYVALAAGRRDPWEPGDLGDLGEVGKVGNTENADTNADAGPFRSASTSNSPETPDTENA
uniref:hypothetical protein n=1 Tax=Francisella tularensis TaxID=263 RepID=UPI001C0EC5FB